VQLHLCQRTGAFTLACAAGLALVAVVMALLF